MMTTEVVIMNKHGLSMAADSAITSGREGMQKIYNSANKLYALSDHHPIGIMVYGAGSFMEVPWDIIIKTYRSFLGKKNLFSLTYYMLYVLYFLEEDDRFSQPDMEKVIVYRTFSNILKLIVKEVEDETNVHDPSLSQQELRDRVTDCLSTCVLRY